jgi:DNA-binding protein YbaB
VIGIVAGLLGLAGILGAVAYMQHKTTKAQEKFLDDLAVSKTNELMTVINFTVFFNTDNRYQSSKSITGEKILTRSFNTDNKFESLEDKIEKIIFLEMDKISLESDNSYDILSSKKDNLDNIDLLLDIEKNNLLHTIDIMFKHSHEMQNELKNMNINYEQKDQIIKSFKKNALDVIATEAQNSKDSPYEKGELLKNFQEFQNQLKQILKEALKHELETGKLIIPPSAKIEIKEIEIPKGKHTPIPSK